MSGVSNHYCFITIYYNFWSSAINLTSFIGFFYVGCRAINKPIYIGSTVNERIKVIIVETRLVLIGERRILQDVEGKIVLTETS